MMNGFFSIQATDIEPKHVFLNAIFLKTDKNNISHPLVTYSYKAVKTE